MDNKITISRGYTRKINLGNYIKTKPYESTDFFANYSEEFDKEGFTKSMAKKASEKLITMAQNDVEGEIASYLMAEINNMPRKFKDPVDKNAKALNSFIEDLEE